MEVKTKFHVGDKVKLIDENSMSARVGATAIVYDIGEYLYVNWIQKNKLCVNQYDGAYSENRFELVEEEKCEPCSTYSDFQGIELNSENVAYYMKQAIEKLSKTDYMVGIDWAFNSKKQKTIMSKITTFAKNLVLSADEKLLRKYGLHDECGNHTDEAEDLVIAKLVKENEAYLIELAKGMELEEKSK